MFFPVSWVYSGNSTVMSLEYEKGPYITYKQLVCSCARTRSKGRLCFIAHFASNLIEVFKKRTGIVLWIKNKTTRNKIINLKINWSIDISSTLAHHYSTAGYPGGIYDLPLSIIPTYRERRIAGGWQGYNRLGLGPGSPVLTEYNYFKNVNMFIISFFFFFSKKYVK